MRITTQMMTTNYTKNLNTNLNQLQSVTNQINTGQIVSKPSDNPFLATRMMEFEAEIASKEQYKRNIEDIDGFLTMSDSALGQLNDQFTRIKELTIQASTGTNTESELAVISKEVNQIIHSMVDTLNTNFEDKYIFSGYQTDTKPFELIENPDGTFEVRYHGDANVSKVEISKGIEASTNITGVEILGDYNGRNLFESLNEISKALSANDQNALTGLLEEVNAHQSNILQLRGKVGAQQSRMEIALNRSENEILNLKNVLSKAADTDLASAIIEAKTLETAYLASLQASSYMFQPSLLNFLK